MHRDQKIGLSLAVLIIGFAGAFCFRNEPLSDPQPLALEQTAALDSRIERLPIRAYTERDGTDGLIGHADKLNRKAEIVDVAVIERPVEPMEAATPPTGHLISLFAGPPEPVRTDDVPTTAGHNHVRDTTEPDSLVRPVRPASSMTVEAAKSPSGETADHQPQGPAHVARGRTYIVQSGDTLSGISLQMYGTVRQFLDIYQANRDVLKSPNDLPVGATLRIP